jgi:hypothetical protein
VFVKTTESAAATAAVSVDDDRWRAGFDAVISLIAPRFKRRFKRRETLANSEAFVLG